MAFTKGKSGNPHGREKGSQNKATAAVKERIEQVLSDLDTTLTADRARGSDGLCLTTFGKITTLTRTRQTMQKSPQPEFWPRAFLLVNQMVT